MKQTLFFFFSLLALAGCGTASKDASNLTTINLAQPSVQMISEIVADMDQVEYIPLETTSEFLCTPYGQIAAVTDDLIIYYNPDYKGGDILLFDGKGKALKKINRKGESGEEYPYLISVVYDDKNKELFVVSFQKIVVYDLEGHFKRSLPFLDKTITTSLQVRNFDDRSLLCYLMKPGKDIRYPFFLISKLTGEKIQDIEIPYKERISTSYNKVYSENGSNSRLLSVEGMTEYGTNQFLLNDPSSDTLYVFGQDKTLKPLIVRTPSINGSASGKLLVAHGTIDGHIFLTAYKMDLKNEYGLPQEQGFIYNSKNDSIYAIPSLAIRFNFFRKGAGQETLSCLDLKNISMNFNVKTHETDKNTLIFQFASDFLIQQYNTKGDFSDKFKAMISNLEADDNPVLIKVKGKIALIKY